MRLRRAGARTFRLELTRSGRRILGSCRALVIDARGRSGARRFARARRAWRCGDDPSRCRAPAPVAAAAAGAVRQAAGEDHLRAAREPPAPGRAEHRERRPLRLPRPLALPLPVPQRPLHRGGRVHAHQAAAEHRLLHRRPRARRRQQTIDTTDQNRADGFSPGNMIVTRVPGLDSPAGVRADRAPCRSPTWRAASTPKQPVVVINARTKQRQLIWAEIDSNPLDRRPAQARGRDPDHPARARTSRRASATSWRCAGCASADGHAARAARGVPRLPRRDRHAPTPTSRRAARSSRASSRPSARRASRARTSTSPGTSPWRASRACRAARWRCATTRSSSWATPTSADLDRPGRLAAVRPEPRHPGLGRRRSAGSTLDPIPSVVDFERPRRSAVPALLGGPHACEAGESDRTARRVTGQITVPCYLDQPTLPARLRASWAATPCADRRATPRSRT